MSEFKNISHFDERLVQKEFVNTVIKGGGSLSVTEYRSINSSDSTIQFSCNTSRGSFIDRYVLLESDITIKVNLNFNAGNKPADGAPIFTPGIDFSIESNTFQKMSTTINGSINSTQQSDKLQNGGLLDYITESA